MAVLGFPREPYVELFLGGEYRDVASHVRQGTPLTFTHGRKDWAGKFAPGKFSFTLDDGPDGGNGDYHPDNALGQWYGTLNQNVPVRAGLTIGLDNFTRADDPANWGTGPLGTWTSPLGDATLVGNFAFHSFSATNTYRYSRLGLSAKNADVQVDCVTNVANVTGNSIEPAGIMLRVVSSTSYYTLRITVLTAEIVQIALFMHNTQLSDTITVPMVWAGQTFRVRFQADENTFRGKVWDPVGPEPLAWQLEYSHGDVWDAGDIGIRSGVAGANTNAKPIVFRYTNLVVRKERFVGEVVSMTPAHEEDHSNQRTAVECAGIARRLGRSSRVLDSPFERYMARTVFSYITYHPLDDDSDAQAPGRAVAGTPALFSRGAFGAVKWGVDTKRPSVPKAVELKQGGTLAINLDATQYAGNRWAATWTHQSPADSTGAVYIFTDNPLVTYYIEILANGALVVSRIAGGTDILFNISAAPAGYVPDDNRWQDVGFSFEIFSGDTYFQLSYLGTLYSAGRVGVFAERPNMIAFIPADSSSTNTLTVGHVATWTALLNQGTPTLMDSVRTAMNGHSGEAAGTRFVRLLTEEGHPYALNGYPTITQHMGPQGQDTLLALVQECVEVDQGVLRDGHTLAMRTGRALISQPTMFTLDYADGHVARPFSPVRDDQNIVNDVTAKRVNGGTYRDVKTTGPLNSNDPGTDPDGVGVYDQSVTVNCETDGDLIEIASWRVHQGTVDEPRFPTLTVNLAAADIDAALAMAVLDANIGDPVTITNLDAARIYDDVRLIAQGYTEIVDTAFRHTITFNTTPASPYDGTTLDSSQARFNTDTTITTASFVAGTDVLMTIVTLGALWTRDAANFPMDIRVAGSVLTVTNCTGSTQGAVQQLTVSTVVVNGVAKTIPAGALVSIEPKKYLVP